MGFWVVIFVARFYFISLVHSQFQNMRKLKNQKFLFWFLCIFWTDQNSDGILRVHFYIFVHKICFSCWLFYFWTFSSKQFYFFWFFWTFCNSFFYFTARFFEFLKFQYFYFDILAYIDKFSLSFFEFKVFKNAKSKI